MARKRIPRDLRRVVRARAADCCEYCRHPDAFTCAPFVCEHIQPRARGGGSELDDLAWSCAGCNGHKADKTLAADPKTGRMMPLFNPRRQSWSRHFRWSSDALLIVGRTAIGRATVAALELNRAALVNLRQMLFLVGKHPPEGKPPIDAGKRRDE
jgi:hypothetical protein